MSEWERKALDKHQRVDRFDGAWCVYCEHAWPCPTIVNARARKTDP